MVVGDTQLRFSDATVQNTLTEGLQPTTVRLDKTKVYALCRSGGKKPANAVPLVVTCLKVSSVHCLVTYDGSRDCWVLTDGDGVKKSTNGTFLDGVKVAPRGEEKLPGTADLLPGTTISIKVSSVAMHFELTPEAEAEAAQSAAAEEHETTEEASTTAAAAAATASAAAAAAATASAAEAVEEEEDDDDDDDDDDDGASERPPAAATPKEVTIYHKRPDGTSEVLGSVPVRRDVTKAMPLHKDIVRQGLGAAFRNGQFQFLKPMKPGQPPVLPIWEPQEKRTLITDLLHPSPDRSLPGGNCITIRSLPLRDDESVDDDDESVASALKQPVPPSNKGKKASGVAQERAAAAASGAPPAAKVNLKDDDPDDPKPKTPYEVFKQERTAEREAASGPGPKPKKNELAKLAKQEWESDPKFASRKRKLEEQQQPLRDAWSKKRKDAASAAAAETSASTAQPGFVTPDSVSSAAEDGHARGHADVGASAYFVEDIDD